MGGVGYEDWDKIVQAKEDSLKLIYANKRNLEVGEIVEKLVLSRALIERRKYPKPAEVKMDEENPDEEKKEE